jgi:predicted DNA-binding protein (UPF0251 family)
VNVTDKLNKPKEKNNEIDTKLVEELQNLRLSDQNELLQAQAAEAYLNEIQTVEYKKLMVADFPVIASVYVKYVRTPFDFVVNK